jgi:hypothetical protein
LCIALHGAAIELPSVEEAIRYIQSYQESDAAKPVIGYEIQVRYNNGDRIDGRFADKAAAVSFLDSYRAG